MEACRDHADDGVTPPFQCDCLTQHVRSSTKFLLPQSFAYQRNRTRTGLLFRSRERTSEHGMNPEQGEKVRRYEFGAYPLGVASAGEVKSITTSHRHR